MCLNPCPYHLMGQALALRIWLSEHSKRTLPHVQGDATSLTVLSMVHTTALCEQAFRNVMYLGPQAGGAPLRLQAWRWHAVSALKPHLADAPPAASGGAAPAASQTALGWRAGCRWLQLQEIQAQTCLQPPLHLCSTPPVI